MTRASRACRRLLIELVVAGFCAVPLAQTRLPLRQVRLVGLVLSLVSRANTGVCDEDASFTHRYADETQTPNRSAATRGVLPVSFTSAICRSRSSTVCRLRMPASCHPSPARNRWASRSAYAAMAADLVEQLDALGFGSEARALRPSTPSAVAAAPTPGGFMNVNVGI